jgi:hypothetical protein
MKKSLIVTFVVCLASVIGVVPASAQSRTQIKLTLPVAVTFGTVTLPAGNCTVTEIKDNGNEIFFLMRSEAGPAVELLMQRTGEPAIPSAASSSVHLRHVGAFYELEGVKMDGQDYRYN